MISAAIAEFSFVVWNDSRFTAYRATADQYVTRLESMLHTYDYQWTENAPYPAAYFKTFVKTASNGSYIWSYGGARTGNPMEDTNHGHIDLSLLIWAKRFGLGGLTDADMSRLVLTLKSDVLNGAAGSGDVSKYVDGTGMPSSNWDRVEIGYDWIDLAQYDKTVLDKVIGTFNRFMPNPSSGWRFSFAWAEILRRNNGVEMW